MKTRAKGTGETKEGEGKRFWRHGGSGPGHGWAFLTSAEQTPHLIGESLQQMELTLEGGPGWICQFCHFQAEGLKVIC